MTRLPPHIMDIFPPTDPNIEETQEWRDALLSLIASDGPGRAVQILDELVRLARAQGLGDISPAMLEGFAAAKVLVEGLKRAGHKPSREKIQAALEGLRKFDLGGLAVSYSPEDHTGLDFADLSIIGTDGKFRR